MTTRQSKMPVAIIGAGVSGLACAYRLSQRGIRATVFEREPEVGGRTKVARIDGEYVPTGAGVLYVGGESDAMCGELGIERHLILPKNFSTWYEGVTVFAATDA